MQKPNHLYVPVQSQNECRLDAGESITGETAIGMSARKVLYKKNIYNILCCTVWQALSQI